MSGRKPMGWMLWWRVMASRGCDRTSPSHFADGAFYHKGSAILPLGSLVSILGYELVWTKKKCFLRAPDGQELALKVDYGVGADCEDLARESSDADAQHRGYKASNGSRTRG